LLGWVIMDFSIEPTFFASLSVCLLKRKNDGKKCKW